MAIVVSHIASSFDALARQATRQAPLADIIELRLDRIGDPGGEALAGLIAELKKPVIVALHGSEAFGDFTGDVDERLDILRSAAASGASFVDVDYRISLDLGEVRGEGKCHRIVSRHETEDTPEDLASITEEVRDVLYEGDLIKVVTHATCCEDGLAMLQFVRETGGGMIGFCSGEAGSFTRVLAPIFGSPFTYASPAEIPGEPVPEATAPGQVRVNDLRAMYPPGGMSVQTAIFGVVGNPARHSWSPRVQGMTLKAAKLDAVYVPFEVEDFARFTSLVQDDSYRGFSITAPFKGAAFEASRSRDGASEATGATNTWIREQHGWRGLNTDVGAIGETLEGAFRIHGSTPDRPVALGAATTLVLGTGGAARAVLQAVREAGGSCIVAGRDASKAKTLAATFDASGIGWDEIPNVDYDTLVHCTPVGSLAQPDELPLPAEWIRPGTLVLDAVYRPLKTPLLREAMAKGCTAVPGGEWFVRQAEAQFRLFTGQEPDRALMRAAFDHAYQEDRAEKPFAT